MSVLLISAPFNYISFPPLGIALLKGYLNQNGIYAETLDSNIRLFRNYFLKKNYVNHEKETKINDWILGANHLRMSAAYLLFEENGMTDENLAIAADLKSLLDEEVDAILAGGFEIHGFSVNSSNYLPSLYMARAIKQRRNETPIIFGGPYVEGGVGDAILSTFPFVDFLVKGEGEIPLLKLVRMLLSKSLDLHSDQKVFRAGDKDFVEGFPDYSSFDMDLYEPRNFKNFSLSPTIPVITSRGCAWGKCVFCSDCYLSPMYKPRVITNVIREIYEHSSKYNTLSFIFHDLAFNGDTRHALNICNELISHGRSYIWEAMVRPKTMTYELMNTMYKAGCRGLFGGIEALGSSVLKYMNKGCSADQNIKVIEWAIDCGIIPKFNFISFHPHETMEDVKAVYDYLKRNFNYLKGNAEIRTSGFWVLYGSTVHSRPDLFNIEITKPFYPSGIPQSVVSELQFHELDWKYTNGQDIASFKERSKLWEEIAHMTNEITNTKSAEGDTPTVFLNGKSFVQIYRGNEINDPEIVIVKDINYLDVINMCREPIHDDKVRDMCYNNPTVNECFSELLTHGLLSKSNKMWSVNGIWI